MRHGPGPRDPWDTPVGPAMAEKGNMPVRLSTGDIGILTLLLCPGSDPGLLTEPFGDDVFRPLRDGLAGMQGPVAR